MDFVLADRLCRDVSRETGVPVLPTLPYGCSLGHSKRWPGTIALDPVLTTQLVNQIGTWAYHSGVRRLFLVNAHVTNAAPLRCALELLRAAHDDLMIAAIDTATMSERVRHAHFADAADWHANEAETALMMAIAPASRASATGSPMPTIPTAPAIASSRIRSTVPAAMASPARHRRRLPRRAKRSMAGWSRT